MTIATVNDLCHSIQAIVVKDYGDFKRKVITYLNRYSEAQTLSDQQQKELAALKWYIQYHPNHKIHETKRWTLNQLKKWQ